jgi:metal-responsive CopG/Arc/MetJ family transcriptional regulator
MEIVTVKFQEDILKKIDKTIAEHDFNSRTEFIREAVRDKIKGLDREDLIREFVKLKGSAKKRKTDEEREKIRKLAFEELVKEKRWN